MKLIKPLLIYITWISFVWFCIGFIASDYQILLHSIHGRVAFVVAGLMFGLYITIIITLIHKELE